MRILWPGLMAGIALLFVPGVSGADDLDATATPPGFDGPIVPRDDSLATSEEATQTTPLDGGAANTYLNWGIHHLGPGPYAAWRTRMLLDGEPITTQEVADGNLPGWFEWLNVGPFTVRGGRHTLTSIADLDGSVAEIDEANNTYARQFIWSPTGLLAPTVLVRNAPPDPGVMAQPNADGFLIGSADNYPWVVSMAPLRADDDYDLRVYDSFSFDQLLGVSSLRGSGTEFFEAPQHTSTHMESPAIVRYAAGSRGDFAIDLETGGLGNPVPGSHSFPGEVLQANQLARMYVFATLLGERNYVTLTTPPGADDLACALFLATGSTGHSRAEANANSTPVSSQIDTVSFVAPSRVSVIVIVFRPDGLRAGERVTYDLEWNDAKFVDAGDPEPGRIALRASPNPLHGEGRFVLDLPAAATATLSIHDVRGREVARPFDGRLSAGPSSIRWETRDAAGRALRAGVYFAALEAGSRQITTRIVVLP